MSVTKKPLGFDEIVESSKECSKEELFEGISINMLKNPLHFV